MVLIMSSGSHVDVVYDLVLRKGCSSVRPEQSELYGGKKLKIKNKTASFVITRSKEVK